jgi:hypothetical protein
MLGCPLLPPLRIADDLSNRRFGQTPVLEKRKHVQQISASSYFDHSANQNQEKLLTPMGLNGVNFNGDVRSSPKSLEIGT